MGLGNIQISEIYAYMRMFAIDNLSERATFLERIQFMDSIYMNYQNERTRERQQKTKKGSVKKPRR